MKKQYDCKTWKKSVLFCDGSYGEFKKDIAGFLLVGEDNEGIKGPELGDFGLTLCNNSGGVVVWMDSRKIREHSHSSVEGILAHELTHAAIDILSLSNVRVDYENQEPLAYLVEELYGEFEGCVSGKEKRKEVKTMSCGKKGGKARGRGRCKGC